MDSSLCFTKCEKGLYFGNTQKLTTSCQRLFPGFWPHGRTVDPVGFWYEHQHPGFIVVQHKEVPFHRGLSKRKMFHLVSHEACNKQRPLYPALYTQIILFQVQDVSSSL